MKPSKIISNLIYKDFKIAFHPSLYIFILLAPSMLFIPNYPRPIGFFYLIIGIMNIFNVDLQYKDREFCGLLPVRKKDCVKARMLSISILELGLMLITVPFAFLAHSVLSKNGGNTDGMNINVTLYALILIGYAIANRIIIPGGYKKQFRVYARSFIAMAVFMLFTISAEIIIASINDGKLFLNGTSLGDNLLQLPVLAGAAVIFFAINFWTYKVTVKGFEAADI